MLQKSNQIEISHLTHETQEKFGCTFSQREIIVELIGKCKIPIQNYLLDKLGLSINFKYKLDTVNAYKLIDCLLNSKEFELIEYNTYEWHQAKAQELQEKLIDNPKPNISLEWNFSEDYQIPDL